MPRKIEETTLPGVGIRFSFEAENGERVSVLHHHSGRREVFVADPEDPDASREVLDLDEEDSRVLADLLGGTQVVESIGKVRQAMEDVALDWVPVEERSEAVGRTIAEIDVRQSTGAMIVAVVREGKTMPAPGPDFEITPGDTLVVAGDATACDKAQDLFRGH